MLRKQKNYEKSFFLVFCYTCVNLIENYLTFKRKSEEKAIQAENQKIKILGKYVAKIVDWVLAFFWAAIWVFLINQYFLQAYMIPSESMVPTLIIADRVFVNKLLVGPELLPGFKKLPSLKTPKRGEVVIFSNPELISASNPIFQIVHRLLYMLSFSMIDLGGQESLAQLLVKRSVGSGGDYIIFRDGNLYIRPEGLQKFYNEHEFQNMTSLSYPIQRLIPENKKEYNRVMSVYNAYQAALNISAYPSNTNPPSEYQKLKKQVSNLQNSQLSNSYYDLSRQSSWDTYLATLYRLMPYDRNIKKQYLQSSLGYYVPHGSFLPLGDNRDNSRDGRFFGTVLNSQILGYWIWRFYPFNRIGKVL